MRSGTCTVNNNNNIVVANFSQYNAAKLFANASAQQQPAESAKQETTTSTTAATEDGAPEVVQKIKSPIFMPAEDDKEFQQYVRNKRKQQRMGLLLIGFGTTLLLISGYYFYAVSNDPILKTQGLALIADKAEVKEMVKQGDAANKQIRDANGQVQKLDEEYKRLQAKMEKDIETRRKYAPKE